MDFKLLKLFKAFGYFGLAEAAGIAFYD